MGEDAGKEVNEMAGNQACVETWGLGVSHRSLILSLGRLQTDLWKLTLLNDTNTGATLKKG